MAVEAADTGPPTQGGCLCGGVSFAIMGELRSVSNCHCEPCRRFTGHHMAATAVAPPDIEFLAGDSLRWFESAPDVEYGFCSTCGASLFWRTSSRPGLLSICAGSLNPPTGLTTTVALFMNEHGDYHVADPVEEQLPGDRP